MVTFNENPPLPSPVYTSIKNSNTASYHRVRLEGTDRALNTVESEQGKGRVVQKRSRGGRLKSMGAGGRGMAGPPQCQELII